jgi:hypothetical protein
MRPFPESEKLMLQSTFPVMGVITFMKLHPNHGRRTLELQSSHCLQLTKTLHKMDPSFQISDAVRFHSWPFKKQRPNVIKVYTTKGAETEPSSDDILEVGTVVMTTVTPSKYFTPSGLDEDSLGQWFLEFKTITAIPAMVNDEEVQDPDQAIIQEHLQFLLGF